MVKYIIIAIAFATLAAFIVGLIILFLMSGETPDPDEEIDRIIGRKEEDHET